MKRSIQVTRFVPAVMAVGFLVSALLIGQQGVEDIEEELHSASQLASRLAQSMVTSPLGPTELASIQLRHIRIQPASSSVYRVQLNRLERFVFGVPKTLPATTQFVSATGEPWQIVLTPEDEISELEDSLLLALAVFVAAGALSWVVLGIFTQSMVRKLERFENELGQVDEHHTPNWFSERHSVAEMQELQQTFNRSLRALHGAHEEISELSAHLVDTQERERRILAQELHDNLGQIITGARALVYMLGLEVTSNVQKDLDKALKEAHQVLRGLIHNLDPLDFQIQRFDEAVALLCQHIEKVSDLHMACRLDWPSELDAACPVATKVGLYRIIQESLTNVIKHAQADKVEVCCTLSESDIVISVADNGRGLRIRQQGYGLRSMKERAKALQANLAWNNRPEGGCEVRCHLKRREA